MNEIVKTFLTNIQVFYDNIGDLYKRKDIYVVKRYITEELTIMFKMDIPVPQYVLTLAMNLLAVLDRVYWEYYKDNIFDKLRVFKYSLIFNNNAKLNFYIIDLVDKLDLEGWSKKHQKDKVVSFHR